MSDQTQAPFDPSQVKALQWFQRGLAMTPYVCESQKTHKGHRPVLKADTFGLTCPECGEVRESVPAGIITFSLERLGRPDTDAAPAAKKTTKGRM